MEGLGGTTLSVIAAALIIGILGDLMPKSGSMGNLFRMIGGLFLAFTLISPVVRLDFSNLDDFLGEFAADAEYHSEAGASQADEMYRSIIKSRTEAYILDKAVELQTELGAEVKLSSDANAVPVSVQLTGEVSPYAKGILSQMIEEELGIAKENQIWNG